MEPSWNPDTVNPGGNTNGTQVKPRQNPRRTQVEPKSSLLTYRAVRLHPGSPLPTARTFESNNMTPFGPTVHLGPKKDRIKR